MNIITFKGKVLEITSEYIELLSADGTSQIRVISGNTSRYALGQQVNLVLQLSDNKNEIGKIIGEAEVNKKKSIKIKNFSSLISQMIKFKDRISVTLDEAIANDANADTIEYLRERNEFLERGIELFSEEQ